MQNLLNRAVIASRYILVVFFVGLVVALAAYAARFAFKVWKFMGMAVSPSVTYAPTSLQS